MRIVLIVVYYPPSPTSAAQMMRRLALEYVRQGHSVTVVTTDESLAQSRTVSEEEDVRVIRVNAGKVKNAPKVLRLWREMRLGNRIWSEARDIFEDLPADLIVYYSPTIFLGKLVSRLKRMWKCPAYLVLRDIFPRWAVEAGILKGNSLLYRYLRRRELEEYAPADHIGVEAKSDLHYFSGELTQIGGRAEFLPNWIDRAVEPANPSAWRTRLKLEGKVVFFYGGNLGVVQDMDNILRLATSLRDREDVFFLVMGSGSEAPRLEREIERLKPRNLLLLPPMAEKDYLECLCAWDVGLVSLDRRLRSHNFPGKILGYLACGKPVLASINAGNDSIEILKGAGAGLVCINGEDESLRDAALSLASDPQLRKRLGNNARSLAGGMFFVQTVARQILSHFQKSESVVPVVASKAS